jgi:hypothetical protein
VETTDRAFGERSALPFAAERLDDERADEVAVTTRDLEDVGKGAATGAATEASEDHDDGRAFEQSLQRGFGGAGEDAADERGASGVDLFAGIRAEVDPTIELLETLYLRVAVDRHGLEMPDVPPGDLPPDPNPSSSDRHQDEPDVLA